MKQYIANTGGRYTYADDFLNLQELALSMTSIFYGCSNFIISGCEIKGSKISSGYVWINGHIRYFEGCTDARFPYYIYEKNNYDTVVYANDVNKNGRCNYLCTGASSRPTTKDEVTNKIPGFIELTETYSPRLIDNFFGKYAVLLENPFSKQSIRGDIDISGSLKVNGSVHYLSSMVFGDPAPEATLRIGPTGELGTEYSIAMHANQMEGNAVATKLVMGMQGKFQFMKNSVVTVSIDGDGMNVKDTLTAKTVETSSLRITDSNIYLHYGSNNANTLYINRYGYNGGNTVFRSFAVFDGRNISSPLFMVEGAEQTVKVQTLLYSLTDGQGIEIGNKAYDKTDNRISGTIFWSDRKRERMASVGYEEDESFNFILRNPIGSILLNPGSGGCVDIMGDLKVNGENIHSFFVSVSDFNVKLNSKVDKVNGKGLSTEDFTSALKQKLENIKSDPIGAGTGYVVAKDVHEALSKKLTIADNLGDLKDKAMARSNLEVYSKPESRSLFLQTSNYLSEIPLMSASEIEGLSPEQVLALQAKKQETARNNIDAEKKGTGDLKLAKASNLSDVADKTKARQNISVYSIEEINQLLAGKLDSNNGYTGAVFTNEHKVKLEGIKTGQFSGTDSQGQPVSQTEGYVMTSAVVTQLRTKANLLLDGYTATQKNTIADNIAVYSKSGADSKFSSLSSSFQDYINYLTAQGKTTSQAQQTLRDKIDAPAKGDLNNYLRKDGRLTDLTLGSDTIKRQVCNTLGAAFAADYQPKLTDTGWISCTGSNSGTLFARQIGNIVCIQGKINTGKRTGSNWGGVVAVVPNQISPPRYACRTTLCTYNNSHKYNRGSSFVISAGSRNIILYESGWNNETTEIHFSYMT